MLTSKQINLFKSELLTRQTVLIEQSQERVGSSSAYTDSVERLSGADSNPEDKLEAINKALHAIAEGTYGFCRVCSLDIAYERLEAVPALDTCNAHAAEESVASYYAEDAWQEVS